MTLLRQRMLDALELRGMAARTVESYIDAVARLARHYGRSPDTLDAEQVRQYLLHLLRERHLARSSVNRYGCAYRFFYGVVLGLDGDAFQIPLAPAPQRLPEILSREEIARLVAAACHDKARSLLMLAYGSGLRLSELCSLRVADIDSAHDRMCIRVVQGKGAMDRYVPLAADVLALLRRWWRAARMAELLDVPYAHLVFTLPHELNALAGAHPRWVCETLLQCVAATLARFAADRRWLGGAGSFTLVLHAWTQDLRRHLHVHALVACGALGRDAGGAPAWIEPKRTSNFLFPVHALSKVFKGKFLAALERAEDGVALARDPAADPANRGQRRRALARHDWVVYAKTPLAGPAVWAPA